VVFVRLAYTALVMAGVVWLLRTGQPLGGLVILPLLAIWLRRKVESGEPARVWARRRSS
jgi:hypothetical protein